jgi:hypothetical protein
MSLKAKLLTNSFSPLLPLYTALRSKRPLPTQSSPAAEQNERSEEEEEQGEEVTDNEETEDEETQVDTQRASNISSARKERSKSASVRKKSGKNKSKHHSDEPDVDDRRPLGEVVHSNKERQRQNQHPTMARPKRGSCSNRKGYDRKSLASATGGKGYKSATSDSDQEPTEHEKENAALREKLERLTKRMKLERSGPSRAVSTNEVAMIREVKKHTKKRLWKRCKFFISEKKLLKGTKFVMKGMHLTDLEGLRGRDLIHAQEDWIATYKNVVREAINKQRNYVQQELHDYMFDEVFKKGLEEQFPTDKDIRDLVLRDKLDGDTPDEERAIMETKFDNYWNVLMPKAAGDHSWGKSKRHYGLMSTALLVDDAPEDEQQLCVSAADEAFLALIWLNCYKKWWYNAQVKRGVDKKDLYEKDLETPFTDPKSGQAKFGGWKDEGLEEFKELCTAIEKNRMKEKVYLKNVETAALKRIRTQEKVDELDAKRSEKKKKGNKKRTYNEDENDEESDYEQWV